MPVNPLTDVMKDWTGGNVKKGYEAAEGLGTELGAKAKMVSEARKALMPSAPAPAAASSGSSAKDKINPKAQYGDKPGEKRMDVSEATKPLGSFKKGGEAPKSGVYTLEKGEHVLTPEQKNRMHNMLGLAESTLAHDPAPEPKPPKKELREMRIRKGASGGHIIQHSHQMPHLHPDEEHVTSNSKELMKHIMDHMAGNVKETPEEESKESPALEKMEQSAGVK